MSRDCSEGAEEEEEQKNCRARDIQRHDFSGFFFFSSEQFINSDGVLSDAYINIPFNIKQWYPP